MKVYHGSYIEIVEKLILDFNFEEEKETDSFFSSITFIKLADESTAL